MEYLSNIAEKYSKWTASKDMEQPAPTLREDIVRGIVDRAAQVEDGKELLRRHVDAVETQGSLDTLLKESEALDTVRKGLKKEDPFYKQKQEAIKSLTGSINTRLRYKVLDSLVDSTDFLVVGNTEEEQKLDLEHKRNEARGVFHDKMVMAATAKNVTNLLEADNDEKPETVRVIDMYREKAKELLESAQGVKKVDLTAKAKDLRNRVTQAVTATILALGMLGISSKPVREAAAETFGLTPTPLNEPAKPTPRPDDSIFGTATAKPTIEPSKVPTATSTAEVETATPLPEATATMTPTVEVNQKPEGLVNPEMYVGSVNLEKDFTIIVPSETAGLTELGTEGKDLTYPIQSAPVSVDQSPNPDIHKEIPKDIQDMFDVKNIDQFGNVGAILRTDKKGNNMVWAHDGIAKATGEVMPLEVVKQLWEVYQQNPDAVKGKYVYVQSTEDPTKIEKLEILEMNEYTVDQMFAAMAYHPDNVSPVLFRVDEGGLNLSEESRQRDVLHFVTCSGSIDFNDPNVASARISMSTRLAAK
jgi:hypothetical protein